MNSLEDLEEIYLDNDETKFMADIDNLNNSNNNVSVKKVVINKQKKKNNEYSFFN